MLVSLQSSLVSGTGPSSNDEEGRAESLSQKDERRGNVKEKKHHENEVYYLTFIMLS